MMKGTSVRDFRKEYGMLLNNLALGKVMFTVTYSVYSWLTSLAKCESHTAVCAKNDWPTPPPLHFVGMSFFLGSGRRSACSSYNQQFFRALDVSTVGSFAWHRSLKVWGVWNIPIEPTVG